MRKPERNLRPKLNTFTGREPEERMTSLGLGGWSFGRSIMDKYGFSRRVNRLRPLTFLKLFNSKGLDRESPGTTQFVIPDYFRIQLEFNDLRAADSSNDPAPVAGVSLAGNHIIQIRNHFHPISMLNRQILLTRLVELIQSGRVATGSAIYNQNLSLVKYLAVRNYQNIFSNQYLPEEVSKSEHQEIQNFSGEKFLVTRNEGQKTILLIRNPIEYWNPVSRINHGLTGRLMMVHHQIGRLMVHHQIGRLMGIYPDSIPATIVTIMPPGDTYQTFPGQEDNNTSFSAGSIITGGDTESRFYRIHASTLHSTTNFVFPSSIIGSLQRMHLGNSFIRSRVLASTVAHGLSRHPIQFSFSYSTTPRNSSPDQVERIYSPRIFMADSDGVRGAAPNDLTFISVPHRIHELMRAAAQLDENDGVTAVVRSMVGRIRESARKNHLDQDLTDNAWMPDLISISNDAGNEPVLKTRLVASIPNRIFELMRAVAQLDEDDGVTAVFHSMVGRVRESARKNHLDQDLTDNAWMPDLISISNAGNRPVLKAGLVASKPNRIFELMRAVAQLDENDGVTAVFHSMVGRVREFARKNHLDQDLTDNAWMPDFIPISNAGNGPVLKTGLVASISNRIFELMRAAAQLDDSNDFPAAYRSMAGRSKASITVSHIGNYPVIKTGPVTSNRTKRNNVPGNKFQLMPNIISIKSGGNRPVLQTQSVSFLGMNRNNVWGTDDYPSRQAYTGEESIGSYARFRDENGRDTSQTDQSRTAGEIIRQLLKLTGKTVNGHPNPMDSAGTDPAIETVQNSVKFIMDGITHRDRQIRQIFRKYENSVENRYSEHGHTLHRIQNMLKLNTISGAQRQEIDPARWTLNSQEQYHVARTNPVAGFTGFRLDHSPGMNNISLQSPGLTFKKDKPAQPYEESTTERNQSERMDETALASQITEKITQNLAKEIPGQQLNVIASKVYQIIEKRLVIEKDRRGIN